MFDESKGGNFDQVGHNDTLSDDHSSQRDTETTAGENHEEHESGNDGRDNSFVTSLREKYRNPKITTAGEIKGIPITGVEFEYDWNDQGQDMVGHRKIFYYGEQELPLHGGISIMHDGRARNYIKRCLAKGLDVFDPSSEEKVEKDSDFDKESDETNTEFEAIKQELESNEEILAKLRELSNKYGTDLVLGTIEEII